MAFTVEVEGLAALNAALEDLPAKVAKQYLRKAAKQASDLFVQSAKLKAPVLKKFTKYRTPGALRDSITSQISIRKKAGLQVKIGPAKKIFYARYVEFGTNKMKAQPFMRPAWDSEKTAALDAFAASIRASIAAYKPPK